MMPELENEDEFFGPDITKVNTETVPKGADEPFNGSISQNYTTDEPHTISPINNDSVAKVFNDFNIFDDVDVKKREPEVIIKEVEVIKEVKVPVKVPVLLDGVDFELIKYALLHGFKTPKKIITYDKALITLGFDSKTNQWYIQTIDSDGNDKYYLVKDHGRTWKVTE